MNGFVYYLDVYNQYGLINPDALPSNFWTNPCSAANDPLGGFTSQLIPDFTPQHPGESAWNGCPLLGNSIAPPPLDCAHNPASCPLVPPQLARTALTFNPGSVTSYPPGARQLVGLNSCFWIAGESNTEERWLELNRSNPQYYFDIHYSLAAVDWNFGDGTTSSVTGTGGLGTQPDQARACANPGSDPVQHTYTDVGSYAVTATEHLGLTVSGYACTTQPDGTQDCTTVQPVDISGICPGGAGGTHFVGRYPGCYVDVPITFPVLVGQIESIPIA